MEPGRTPSHEGRLVWCLRLVYVVALTAVFVARETLQNYVDDMWRYLATNQIFKSAYFETWWVIACYPVILAVPFAISKVGRSLSVPILIKLFYISAFICIMCWAV